MKRIAISAFIVLYLATLGYGTACHMLGYRMHDRIGMYFIVWDMYCGWDAYEIRKHLVAEGESGTCYELTPAPWGSYAPFGSAAREDLDYLANYSGEVARNVLDHTEHEPIVRVYQIDECWNKKYNLPENLWQRRYEEPRERYSYNYIHAIYQPDGQPIQVEQSWKNFLANETLKNNPRLLEEIAAGQPFLPSFGTPGNRSESDMSLIPGGVPSVAKSQ